MAKNTMFTLDNETDKLLDVLVATLPEYANRSHAVKMLVREKAQQKGVFLPSSIDTSIESIDASKETAN